MDRCRHLPWKLSHLGGYAMDSGFHFLHVGTHDGYFSVVAERCVCNPYGPANAKEKSGN